MNVIDLQIDVLGLQDRLKTIADAMVSDKNFSTSLTIGDETFTRNVSKEYILKETEIGKTLVKGCERFISLSSEVDAYTIQGEEVSKEYVNALIDAVLY